MKSKKLKVLFWDIETSPLHAEIWRCGKQVIRYNQLLPGEQYKIICISYKWGGEKTIHSLDWGKKQDCSILVEAFSRIVDQADLIVAHNGDSFDIKHLNAQRLLNNQGPVNWPTTEDSLKQFRRYFYLPSFSLEYLSQVLTGSGKDPMCQQDWRDVRNNVPGALAKMKKYCSNDVRKLEQVYDKLAPFAQAKVHAGIASGGTRDSCPRCASGRVHKYGIKTTNTGRYQKYQCQECGHTFKDSRRIV